MKSTLKKNRFDVFIAVICLATLLMTGCPPADVYDEDNNTESNTGGNTGGNNTGGNSGGNTGSGTGGNNTGNQNKPANYVIDIHEISNDWDLLGVGTDGSSMFLKLNDNSDEPIPIRAYFKPKKDRDVGSSFFFKENGLPDIMVANGFVVYFSNFNGYRFDFAVVKPDNTIEYHYNIETDINWDTFTATSIQGRAAQGARFTWTLDDTFQAASLAFSVAGAVVGVISCATALTNPGSFFGCGAFIASQGVSIAANLAWNNIGNDDIGDIGDGASQIALNALDCGTSIASKEWVSVATACASALIDTASMVFSSDKGVANNQADNIMVARETLGTAGGSTYVPVAVTGVTLDKVSLNLSIGDEDYGFLNETVLPANATNKKVTWTTSNANVATVSAWGGVTGVSEGSAAITVTTEDGFFTAKCIVSVSVSPGTTGLKYEMINSAGSVVSGSNSVNAVAYQVSKGDVTGGKVIIPATHSGMPVTKIASSAFYNTAITSVTIPNSVTTIESSAFRDCANLTSVTFAPASKVATIGGYAFYGCTKLTSVTIPNSVTSIGATAFRGCTSLTSVTIGNGVASIGSDAFYQCAGLISITIPDSVTSIGSTAFGGCTGLTSVTIGNGVTSLTGFSFSTYTNLASVTIGNSVAAIDSNAFYGLKKLTSVTFTPTSKVATIGSGAFQGCTGLTDISITIPNSVTSIETSAFSGCTGLTSITIPDSVTSIGTNAFTGCTGLTSIEFEGTIPSSGFSTSTPFPGDIRAKFYATDTANGTAGTYTRPNGTSLEWTKL